MLEKKNIGEKLGSNSDKVDDDEKPSTSTKSNSVKSGKIYAD